jgi:dipeptidyl aminopeptidase/acylaminoacyl peptidase
MIPAHLARLAIPGDPRLSPDGRLVAWSLSRLDMEANATAGGIWIAPVDGSAPPRAFTSGPGHDALPRFSPDGTRLAFVSSRDGRDDPQLHVIPVDGGEARRLTDLSEGVEAVAWSPDGRHLAFTSRVADPDDAEPDARRRRPRRIRRLQFKLDDEGWTHGRRRHVFVVPADGSEPARALTEGDFEDAQPTWSPDGRRIAFVSARDDDWDLHLETGLHVVDLAGGAPEPIWVGAGACASPSWSPDGTRIAMQFTPGTWEDFPRHARIAVVDVASGDLRTLTDGLDRNCAPFPPLREPVWESAEDLLFGVEDGGAVHLYRVRADGGAPPELALGGELAVTGFDVAAGVLVHTRSTPTSPAEVHVGERALTDLGAELRAAATLVEPERFAATAPDGQTIDSWLLRPADAGPGPHPTLLSIHGGPFTQYGLRFLDEFQMWAGAGYAVVYCNPRGSSDSTEAWGRGPRMDAPSGGFGAEDADDLLAALDEGLRRFPDVCDPDRLGVLGGSYGGLMTSWLVAKTDRFRAACSERSCNQWVAMFGSSDIAWSFRAYVGSYPFEDPEPWMRVSPAQHAQDIHTPLLILHSESDLRCAVEQAEHLFTSLRILRREVEMVRFPAEGHELSRSGSPLHRVMRFEVILEWFARHLKG